MYVCRSLEYLFHTHADNDEDDNNDPSNDHDGGGDGDDNDNNNYDNIDEAYFGGGLTKSWGQGQIKRLGP